LEGLINSSKLANEDEKLCLRTLDEYNNIEKCLGEVCGIVNLCFKAEPCEIDLSNVEYLKFKAPPPGKKKEGVAAEGEEEGEGEEKAEKAEEKKPSFDPS